MAYLWLLLIDSTKRKHPERVIQSMGFSPVHKQIVGKWHVYRILEGDFPQYKVETMARGVKAVYSDEGLEIETNPGISSGEISDLAKAYYRHLKKLGISDRSWSKYAPRTKSEREKLLEKVGKYAFLHPENLKYPIVDIKGNFNLNGLLAAYKRAAQNKRKKIETLAKEIGRLFGFSWAVRNPELLDPKWRDKAYQHLRAANLLYEKRHYRDAVSRFYYAAFSALAAFAPPGYKPHGKELLDLAGIKNPRTRWEFEQLRKLRKEADYETEKITSKQALQALTFCNNIFKFLMI